MGSAIIRSGYDAWVSSDTPARERPSSPALQLKSGAKEAFVYFQNPVPRGATVTSALLRVYAKDASSGSRTVTVRRVSETWKAGKVNWNNRPATTDANATASIGALTDGQVIELDVTTQLQQIVDGAPNYGWKLTTSATTMHKVGSLDAGEHKPRLVVEWTIKPAAPTGLQPSGGAVSVSKPVLQWDYGDAKGNTTLTGAQVQVDPAQNASAPAWDSGQLATIIPSLDLTGTSYSGLAEGASTSWRVRIQAESGRWSDWSDWATFSWVAKPVLAITNPPDSGVVWEYTPPVTWSLTGATQESWRLQITDAADRTEVLYDTKRRTGAATAHTIPSKVLTDAGPFSAHVMAWDAVDREVTPGDKRYVEDWQDFTVSVDTGVTGVGALQAENAAGTPWIDLTWTRGTAPDSFTIFRDGEQVDAAVPPEDVLASSGTYYKWRDKGAQPLKAHTYTVQAVVNGRQSAVAKSLEVTSSPSGVWLYDAADDVQLVLAGDDAGSWSSADDAAVYSPVGALLPIRVVAGTRGLSGSLSGVLIDDIFGQSLEVGEAALRHFKQHPTQTLWLIAGDLALPVNIGDLTVVPTPSTRKGQIVKAVSFAFWQTDED